MPHTAAANLIQKSPLRDRANNSKLGSARGIKSPYLPWLTLFSRPFTSKQARSIILTYSIMQTVSDHLFSYVHC